MLTKVLDRCFVIVDVDGKQIHDRSSAKCSFNFFSWCLPIFKFIMLLFHSETSRHYPRRHDLWAVYILVKIMFYSSLTAKWQIFWCSGSKNFEKLSDEDCALILRYLLKSCQVTLWYCLYILLKIVPFLQHVNWALVLGQRGAKIMVLH